MSKRGRPRIGCFWVLAGIYIVAKSENITFTCRDFPSSSPTVISCWRKDFFEEFQATRHSTKSGTKYQFRT